MASICLGPCKESSISETAFFCSSARSPRRWTSRNLSTTLFSCFGLTDFLYARVAAIIGGIGGRPACAAFIRLTGRFGLRNGTQAGNGGVQGPGILRDQGTNCFFVLDNFFGCDNGNSGQVLFPQASDDVVIACGHFIGSPQGFQEGREGLLGQPVAE